MVQFFYLLVLLVLAPLLIAFWLEGLKFLASIPNPGALLWFVVGMLVSIVVGIFTTGIYGRFFQISTHELAHAAMADAFAHPVTHVDVDTDSGGLTLMEGGRHNIIIALAPYSIPILTIPFLAVKPFAGSLGQAVNTGIDLMIGLTLGFHYVMHIRQFGGQQPDVIEVGTVPSVGFTYTFMLFFLVLSVGIILGTYENLFGVIAGTLERAPGYYRTALDLLAGAADALAGLLS